MSKKNNDDLSLNPSPYTHRSSPGQFDPPPSTLHPLENPKLLIVEDDESIRTQMKWALVKDYEVFLAEDRSTAIGLFEKERPQVITLDLGLPPTPTTQRKGFSA